MAIGSCTSCQSSASSAHAVRERQNTDRNNEVAANSAREQERVQVQVSFQPDPNRILDIQA